MKRLRVFAPLAASALMVAGCGATGGSVKATRDFALTAPWQDCDRLVVRSRNGAIDVGVSEVGEIRIDGRLSVRGLTQAEAEANLDRLEIVAQPDATDPRTFRVELKVPLGLQSNSPGADFIIRVPHSCAVQADSTNGPIRVCGMKGPVLADTSNGAIEISRIAGDVNADTSNGRIELTAIEGSARARTTNGAVVVKNVAGLCLIDTSNARVQIEDVRGSIRAETSNAGIRADIAPPEGGSVILRTSNAGIHLMLPAEVKAELRLSTSNGAVDADFTGVPAELMQIGNSRLTAKLGGGGSRVVADTSNAAITLRFRRQ